MKVNWWEELNLCLDKQHPNFEGFVAVEIGKELYMGLFRTRVNFPFSVGTRTTITSSGYELPKLNKRSKE